MKISENKYVTLAYDLNVGEGDERELMEQATTENPLEFIFGTNSMLEAFEEQLNGLSESDKFSFSLTPEQAYGDYDEEKIVELPKNIFEVDGKIDSNLLIEGNTIPMMDSSGNRLMGAVVDIKEDTVTMDFNHPLAGETMHFDGTVLGVREASAEEIAALFSGGGGCSGCSSDDCGSGCGCSSGGDCGPGCNC